MLSSIFPNQGLEKEEDELSQLRLLNALSQNYHSNPEQEQLGDLEQELLGTRFEQHYSPNDEQAIRAAEYENWNAVMSFVDQGLVSAHAMEEILRRAFVSNREIYYTFSSLPPPKPQSTKQSVTHLFRPICTPTSNTPPIRAVSVCSFLNLDKLSLGNGRESGDESGYSPSPQKEKCFL